MEDHRTASHRVREAAGLEEVGGEELETPGAGVGQGDELGQPVRVLGVAHGSVHGEPFGQESLNQSARDVAGGAGDEDGMGRVEHGLGHRRLQEDA